MSAGVTAIWLAFLLLFRNGWLGSNNAASIAFWFPLIWLGSIIAAVSAFSTVRADNASKDPVDQTTPRNKTALLLLGTTVDVFFIGLVPFFTASAVIAIGTTLTSSKGYLDLNYAVFTALYAVFLVLLGKIAARVLSGPILSMVLAFFFGLFFGLYSILSGREIETWSSFNKEAYILVVLALVLAVITIGLTDRLRTGNSSALLGVASLGLASIVMVFFVFGSVEMNRDVRDLQTGGSICSNVEADQVCVWAEDEHKLSFLTASVDRMRMVHAYTEIELPASVFAEPGLFPLNTENTYPVRALGGEAHSWPAAQTIGSAMMSWSCGASQDDIDETTEDAHTATWFLLSDVLSNFIYGDIEYAGFTNTDPQITSTRQDLTSGLASLSVEDQARWLGNAMENFRQTCEFSEEIPAP